MFRFRPLFAQKRMTFTNLTCFNPPASLSSLVPCSVSTKLFLLNITAACHNRVRLVLSGHVCCTLPPQSTNLLKVAHVTPNHGRFRGCALSLQVKAGTLVLLHHSLVHYSAPNKSETSRHAYSIHVVEGSEGHVYPKDDWLQRPSDTPF